MNSFYCELCDKEIFNSQRDYFAGCVHYPIEYIGAMPYAEVGELRGKPARVRGTGFHSGDCSIYASPICDCGLLRRRASLGADGHDDVAWEKHVNAIESLKDNEVNP